MTIRKHNEIGFTLIELMIVVTIVGILASIAVPAYRDYSIRSRVGEATSVYYPIKTETAIYYTDTSELPNSLGSLAENAGGRIAAVGTSYAGHYVTSLSVGTNGVVSVLLKDIADLGPAGGETVYFIPTSARNMLNWKISGSIPQIQKYLPIEY